MARKSSTAATAEATSPKTQERVVDAPTGWLNLREEPNERAKILKAFRSGYKVTLNTDVKTPEGWKAVLEGGYVKEEFLK